MRSGDIEQQKQRNKSALRHSQYSLIRRTIFQYIVGEYFDVGEMNVLCANCQGLHFSSERVISSSTRNPRFSSCYNNESSSIPTLAEAPCLLNSLFTEQSSAGRHFPDNIRVYNNFLALGSVVAD